MDKKKMFVILGGVVGVIVLLIAMIFIFVSLNSGRGKSVDAIEAIMVNAAKEYYKKEGNTLPSEDLIVEVTAESLANAGVMQSLDKLAGKNKSCTGKVVVKNVGGKHIYTPYLDCGDTYKTKYLYEEVNGLYTEDGKNSLYKINEELVYRGEKPNNFVKFAGKTWRIVKVTSDNKIALLLEDVVEKSVWDDRYNIDKNASYGINDYPISRAKETVDGYYNEFFNDAQKNLIVPTDLCIGKRGSEEGNRDVSKVECLEVLENQNIGLLTAIDYINASLDSDCINVTSQSCQNYSYLSEYGNNNSWWLMTPSSDTTYNVYRVIGSALIAKASSTASVRPVIYLGDNAVLAGGNGTSEKPYTIR